MITNMWKNVLEDKYKFEFQNGKLNIKLPGEFSHWDFVKVNKRNGNLHFCTANTNSRDKKLQINQRLKGDETT